MALKLFNTFNPDGLIFVETSHQGDPRYWHATSGKKALEILNECNIRNRTDCGIFDNLSEAIEYLGRDLYNLQVYTHEDYKALGWPHNKLDEQARQLGWID